MVKFTTKEEEAKEQNRRLKNNSSFFSLIQPNLRKDQKNNLDRFTLVSQNDSNFLRSEEIHAKAFFSTHVKTEFDKISYWSVMKNGRALFALLSICFSMNLFTFIDTILADNLHDQFGLGSSTISLVYASQCFGFLLTSPFAHKAIEKFDCQTVIIVAQFIQVIDTFMLGPSNLLMFPNVLWLSIFGLVLSGMTFPFTIICAYQELYDAVTT